jgi:predicted dehydrogenase
MDTAKRRIKVAVIGAGGIANSIHFPALAEIEIAQLAAVCDNAGDKAAQSAARFSIPRSYYNYLEMLDEEKPDAVFVLVQPDQSFRISLDCLTRGIHTFIEKPAGITVYQAKTLERVAEAGKIICQVGFNRRYIPLIQEVVRIMREITPIEQVEGYFLKHSEASFYDGCSSALMCDTIHAIDCVRWIAGGTPQKAATLINRYGQTPVDNAWNAVVRFDNGVSGIIKANYNTGGRVHGFEIHGPNASAFINIGFGDMNCNAKILHFDGQGTFSISSRGGRDQLIESLDGCKIAGRSEYFAYYGYLMEDKAFLNSVLTGEKPLADIAEAVRSIEMVDLIEQGRL